MAQVRVLEVHVEGELCHVEQALMMEFVLVVDPLLFVLQEVVSH